MQSVQSGSAEALSVTDTLFYKLEVRETNLYWNLAISKLNTKQKSKEK